MADQNVHHKVVQNTYKLQFGSFGEWQSDMNDGVIYYITNNSTKTIVFGANMSKNIMDSSNGIHSSPLILLMLTWLDT